MRTRQTLGRCQFWKHLISYPLYSRVNEVLSGPPKPQLNHFVFPANNSQCKCIDHIWWAQRNCIGRCGARWQSFFRRRSIVGCTVSGLELTVTIPSNCFDTFWPRASSTKHMSWHSRPPCSSLHSYVIRKITRKIVYRSFINPMRSVTAYLSESVQ